MNNRTQILNHRQIEQKINRIAYQIYEDNYDQKELVIAGIASNGFQLAEIIAKKLAEISSIQISLEELKINKKNPLEKAVELNSSSDFLEGKRVILVDDVLNSGKTLIYGLQPFLSIPLDKLSTVALVNRSHKRYPVSADYVGLSLATTLQEHIEVSLKTGDYSAFLS